MYAVMWLYRRAAASAGDKLSKEQELEKKVLEPREKEPLIQRTAQHDAAAGAANAG